MRQIVPLRSLRVVLLLQVINAVCGEKAVSDTWMKRNSVDARNYIASLENALAIAKIMQEEDERFERPELEFSPDSYTPCSVDNIRRVIPQVTSEDECWEMYNTFIRMVPPGNDGDGINEAQYSQANMHDLMRDGSKQVKSMLSGLKARVRELMSRAAPAACKKTPKDELLLYTAHLCMRNPLPWGGCKDPYDCEEPQLGLQSEGRDKTVGGMTLHQDSCTWNFDNGTRCVPKKEGNGALFPTHTALLFLTPSNVSLVGGKFAWVDRITPSIHDASFASDWWWQLHNVSYVNPRCGTLLLFDTDSCNTHFTQRVIHGLRFTLSINFRCTGRSRSTDEHSEFVRQFADIYREDNLDDDDGSGDDGPDDYAADTRCSEKKATERPWYLLSAVEKKAARAVGYSMHEWDNNLETDMLREMFAKTWDQLSPGQQQNWETLGLNAKMWDDTVIARDV